MNYSMYFKRIFDEQCNDFSMYQNRDTNALVVLLSMPSVEKLDICVHSSEKILLCGCKIEKLALIIIHTLLLNYTAAMSMSSVCVII